MSKSDSGTGQPRPPRIRDGKVPARTDEFDPLVYQTALYVTLSSDHQTDNSGGGVAPPHVADILGITTGAALNALNRLSDAGRLERVWGTVPGDHRPRQSYVVKAVPRFESAETAEYSTVLAHNHERLSRTHD